MFAVIRTGGKQFTVAPGDKIRVEKLDVNQGESIELKDILLLNDGNKTEISTGALEKAVVGVKVLEHGRDEKVIIFKKQRRQNHRRKKGHRQHHTVLFVEHINGQGKVEAPAPKAKASVEAKASKKTTKTDAVVAEKKAPAKKVAADKPVKKASEKKESAEKKAPAKKAPAKKPAKTTEK